MKLKPFRDDCKAFDALFGNKKDFILESQITENYNYIYVLSTSNVYLATLWEDA